MELLIYKTSENGKRQPTDWKIKLDGIVNWKDWNIGDVVYTDSYDYVFLGIVGNKVELLLIKGE